VSPEGPSRRRLSPDGTRIAVNENTGDRDLFVWDIAQKILSKLTQVLT